MLHAAAMLTGLFTVWLLLTQRWGGTVDIALAAAAAAVCLLAAWRFGGLSRGGTLLRAPHYMLLAARRALGVVRGAFSTVRASVAADVTLKPALVRVKTRELSPHTRAVLADMISSMPGAVVVETDLESMLVHVLHEDGVDAVELSRLEGDVAGALHGKRTS